METLADLVERGRQREGRAIDAVERTAAYTHREFSTNAWKAGNLLRHYGVRPGAEMGVVVGPKDPGPDDEPGWLGTAAAPLLAILGGASAGAVVEVGPDPGTPVGSRALVLPDGWLDRYEAAPGCSRLAYGGPPTDADVAHFERELWSENPVAPPEPVAADDPVLRIDGETYTHEDVLSLADPVAREYDLAAGATVALDAGLSIGAIAAGVVAPLSVGATVLIGGARTDTEDVAYVVRRGGDGPGVVDPAAVTD
jgi:hypothetical protein